MLDSLKKEYEVLKNIVTYLTTGAKNLALVYSAVEKEDPTCKGVFFVIDNRRLEGLQRENVTHVVEFVVMKLNCLVMKNFSKSIEDYSELYDIIDIWQDIEYLEAEVSKFIADINITNLETKRALIAFCSVLSIEEFSTLLRR